MKRNLRILISLSMFAGIGYGCKEKSVATSTATDNVTAQITSDPNLIRDPSSQNTISDEVKKLISEQKYQAAQDKLKEQIPNLQKNPSQESEYVTAINTMAQLEMALLGYESAVKILKDAARPKGAIPRWSIELVYAQSLYTYFESYSWEINKREKIQTKEKDLKQWTSTEIFDEINRVYSDLIKQKNELAAQSKETLKPFLEPNRFPGEIRSTLLDSVTHLFVAILNNRQSWKPDEASNILTLNLKDLLDLNLNRTIDLASRSTHPLEKIAYLLHSLKSSHLKNGKKESALDAQISLYELLNQNFSNEEDRELVLASFRKTLDQNRPLEWYSWGQASYARIIQNQGKSDSFIKARALALEGEKAHPESIGAKSCKDIISNIEIPTFSMEAMAVDTQNRRSIELTYKNIDKLYFRSYPFDFKSHLLNNKDYNFWLDYREFEKIKQFQIAKKWTVSLPSTPDYQSHRHFVTPPKHESGFYLVYASAKEDFSNEDNLIVGVQMIFSDLVIVKDSMFQNKKLNLKILNGISGNPEADAKVSVYLADYQKGPQRVFSKNTNVAGIVAIAENDLKDKKGNLQNYFAVAEKENQFTSTLNMFYANSQNNHGLSASSFLFVDRSVYRPGQKLYFKSVLYSGNSEKGQFKVNTNQGFQVYLQDGNGQVIQTLELKSDNFGAAFGEFVIPSGKLLGQWSLRSSVGGWAAVRVEEYKRPTFEVKFPEQKNIWRLNEKVSVEGSAKYYFGAPVTSGSVDYTVYAEVRLPWWCYYSGFHFFWHDLGNRRIVKAGKSKLLADGSFKIDFFPKADKRLSAALREAIHHYTVEANVTDEGGETRTQSSSYQIAFSDLKLNLEGQQSFYEVTDEILLKAHRKTLNGVGRNGSSQVTLYRLNPRHPIQSISDYPLPKKIQALLKSEVSTPGDLLQDRSTNSYSINQHLNDWTEGEKVFEGSLTHSGNGEAPVKIPPQKNGAYRIKVSGKDSFDQVIETSQEFLVAGAQSNIELPFVALLKESTIEPGGKALLFLQSAYKNQKLMIEKTRFGEILESRVWIAGRDGALLEFPVLESDRGGFELGVHMLNDFSFQRQGFGVNVPWSNKELKLEFTKFREELRPGIKEKWSITVKGSDAKKINLGSAQILSFMYDKSLEAIAPYNLASINSVYGRSSARNSISAELGQAQNAYYPSNGFSRMHYGQSFSTDSMRFYSSYGIGGPGSRGYGGRGGEKMNRRMRSSGVNAREDYAAESDLEGNMSPAASPIMAKKASRDESKEVVEKSKQESLSDKKDSDSRSGKSNGSADKGSDLRTQFQETAFFKPDLLLNKDGGVDIEFSVPDSVTTWKVYALAHTQDLKSGMISKEARTIKDLLIRPYLPRFLREGDQFVLKVVVNNTSKNDLAGKLNFQIFDHDTQKDITSQFLKGNVNERAFSVSAAKESSVQFSLNVPHKIGQIDIKVLGSSGAFTDGELKSLMVLPSTLHLAESVFKIIKDKDKKELSFKDLQVPTDPTRVNEKLVVTLNSQLFYNVLSALPYLSNYPYECSEQTLNRFMSTGILGSLFKEFPAVANMAKTMSTRSTRLEKWDPNDPNRRISLEESPWLLTSKGGEDNPENLINVLDERIVKVQRDDSLDKLRKSQTALGGFPWFPGGPPSPYITMYVLYGFSKALEFGVEIPKDMVQNGWKYLHRHYIENIVPYAYKNDCCWEEITFLNYILSNYPAGDWQNNLFSLAERKEMADFSFKHWKQHSPYLKGYLALTLSRMTRPSEAKLVWDSVLDSAKVSETEGTHWQREDRSWLWYNDTTETQAFALRTGMELKSNPKLLDGLVLWLFMNKKLNHWSSTRSTAEVIYSMAHYLKSTKQLGVREEATVTFGNGFKQSFEFPADVYMGGKNQIVLEGDKITSKSVPVTVEKTTPGYMFASLTWHYATDQLPKEDKGDFLKVSRKYFKRSKSGTEFILDPINEKSPLAIGDEIEVQLSIKAKHAMEYVHLRDPRPSGFEPVSQASSHKWDMGIYWFEEVRDSATNFFFERLPHGEYTFKYRVRVAAAGKFRIGSAEIQPLYAP